MYTIKKNAPEFAEFHLLGRCKLSSLDQPTLKKLHAQGCEFIEFKDSAVATEKTEDQASDNKVRDYATEFANIKNLKAYAKNERGIDTEVYKTKEAIISALLAQDKSTK